MTTSLQTLILAAGMGSRLGRTLPKPLTELSDGRTIMQQQIQNIETAFFGEVPINVVVGYRHEDIVERFPDNNYIYNSRYDVTNTSKSLMLALRTIPAKSGVLWFNGDVVFDPAILEQAKAYILEDRSFVTVNTAQVGEEEVKYTVDAEGFINKLSKTVPTEKALGEAVGINYIAPQHRQELLFHLSHVEDQDYFEKGIENAILAGSIQVEPMDISVGSFYAVEVDFADDLSRANEVLR